MKLYRSHLLVVPLSLSLLLPALAQVRQTNPFKAFERPGAAKNRTAAPIPTAPPSTVPIAVATPPANPRFGAGKKTGEVKVNPRDGAQMVWVPAGAFFMGSTDTDKQASPDEKPQHTVKLSGYWMYKTEVTVGQYRKFVAATNSKMPPEPQAKWKEYNPISNVTWSDAKAYCEWAGVRLPTEAEWEKAARGTDKRIYPNGNKFNQNYGWTKEANGGFPAGVGTAPVGSFPHGASPYGCLDMAGNVWEWCQDYYGERYYEVSPEFNPTGPKFSGHRVFRGGGWIGGDSDGRCSNRGSNVPTLFNDTLGFRCAANP